MANVVKGRYTAQLDEGFVVFIIGMRVNKLWQLNNWLGVFRAMSSMLRTLYTHPEHGFKGGKVLFTWREVVLIQYWNSFDDLEKYARNPSETHLPTWRFYNKMLNKGMSVGIFHETYLVEPHAYEALYANMPVYGLAAVSQHIPAVGRRETARRRMGGTSEPAVATPV